MSNLIFRLNANINRICVIHYACTNLSKMPVWIPCISLGEYNTRNMKTFSTIDLKDEKTVLREFYHYVKNNPNNIYVGWNFKDTIYGLPVIERRYKELIGRAPPKIRMEHIIDLDDAIEEVHGKLYVDHDPSGKMYNLFLLNNISTLYFLKGKDEAEYCERKNMRPVEISVNCKVRGIMDVIDLLLDRRLKTTRTITRWSKIRQLAYRAINSTIFRLVTIIATVLTVLGFIFFFLVK